MKDFFDFLFTLIIVFVIVTPLLFLRLKIMSSGTNKEIIKTILIIYSVIILFSIITGILNKNLPKYEVGININIHNKNDSSVEININGIFYYMSENETININNLNSFSGFIAVKTGNNARIWLYTNEKSVFKTNKNVKIKISKRNIKIRSFLLNLTTFVKEYEWYNGILNFLLEKK
jgi:hypothetical protein